MTSEEEFRWLLRNFEGISPGETYPRYCVQVGVLTYWFASYPPAERLADVLTDLHRDQPRRFPSPLVFACDSRDAFVRPVVWWDLKVRQAMHARFGYFFKPRTRARVVSNRLPVDQGARFLV